MGFNDSSLRARGVSETVASACKKATWGKGCDSSCLLSCFNSIDLVKINFIIRFKVEKKDEISIGPFNKEAVLFFKYNLVQ